MTHLSNSLERVTLYGPAFLDRTVISAGPIELGRNHVASLEPIVLGGVFNCARALDTFEYPYVIVTQDYRQTIEEIDPFLPNCCFGISGNPVSAFVIEDPSSSQRTSFASAPNLLDFKLVENILSDSRVASRVAALSYLDYVNFSLEQLRLLKDLHQLLIVDLAQGRKSASLEYVWASLASGLVDYLVISDDEFATYFDGNPEFLDEKISDGVMQGYVVHRPTSLTIRGKGIQSVIALQPVSNILTTGAGDAYLAAFAMHLATGFSFFESAKQSAELTTRLLLDRTSRF